MKISHIEVTENGRNYYQIRSSLAVLCCYGKSYESSSLDHYWARGNGCVDFFPTLDKAKHRAEEYAKILWDKYNLK